MARFDPVERIKRKLTDRMLRAGDLAVREMRVTTGVQAPLIPGSDPPQAATPAEFGAPPRMVSGKGRAGIYFTFDMDDDECVLKFGSSVGYMMGHEMSDHHWVARTLRDIMPQMIGTIQGKSV